MIDRSFLLLSAWLLSLSGQAVGDGQGPIYPIPDGMARLTIERSEEPLLFRQDALIALNGRPVGTLSRGAKLQMDLAPGTWRVSVRARPTAEQSVLAVSLKANTESRVRVLLDPIRFPPEGNASGLANLVRQSLDAPHDDRLPLFKLEQIVVETPEGDR
jgi:hypothetical protein